MKKALYLPAAIVVVSVLAVCFFGYHILNAPFTVILINAGGDPLSDIQIKVAGEVFQHPVLAEMQEIKADFIPLADGCIEISFTRNQESFQLAYGYVTNGSSGKHMVVIPADATKSTVTEWSLSSGIFPKKPHQWRIFPEK